MRLRPLAPRRGVAAWIGAAAPVALVVILAGASGTVAARAVPAGMIPIPGGQGPVVHSVAASAQAHAEGYWSKARMESATPVAEGASPARPARAKPLTIPNPVHFDGLRTVGALFFTTGKQPHFCTASVVGSPQGDLILTAAHCVYGGGSYAADVAFVPQWHDGRSPYGQWIVSRITIAGGWASGRDPDLDFAFLSVAPQRKNGPSLQQTTGALRLGVNDGFDHKLYLVGYNDADTEPVGCSSSSTELDPTQMQVYCNDYQNGTSGGPWILDLNRAAGTGIVFGDIGGYQQGGDRPFLSYSPYYGASVLRLFQQAERGS